MIKKYATLIWIVLITPLVISCASTPGSSAKLHRGELTVQQKRFYDGCNLLWTFENLESSAYQPTIKYVIYDTSLKAVTEGTIRFDNIPPQQYQERTSYVSVNCGKIEAVKIVEAYGQDGLYIGGLHKGSLKFR